MMIATFSIVLGSGRAVFGSSSVSVMVFSPL
jgi:hypothetical protein